MTAAIREKLVRRTAHVIHLLQADRLWPNRNAIDFEHLMEQSPEDTQRELWVRTVYLRTGVTPVLAEENEHGTFNDHAKRHQKSLIKTSDQLIDIMHRAAQFPTAWLDVYEPSIQINGTLWKRQYATNTGIMIPGKMPLSEKGSQNESKAINTDKKIIAVARTIHDFGCNLIREGHNAFSATLFPFIFKNFDPDDPRIRAIIAATFLHDGDAFQGIHDFDELENIFGIHFGRAVRTMIASDKLDIGPHRLSERLYNGLPLLPLEFFRKVPHSLPCIFTGSTNLDFSADFQHATLSIEFSNKAMRDNPEIQRIARALSWQKGNGEEMLVPQAWHQAHKEQGISYAQSFHTTLRRDLYRKEFDGEWAALFSGIKQLKDIGLQVWDGNALKQNELSYLYERDTWQATAFDDFKQQFEQKHRNDALTYDRVPPLLQCGYLLWQQSKHRPIDQYPLPRTSPRLIYTFEQIMEIIRPSAQQN